MDQQNFTVNTGRCRLEFLPASMRGVYCHALVCLAVWLCFSARSVTDKILAIIFPIAGFVAMGFEHCVANMYFVPLGLLLKSNSAFLASLGKTTGDHAALTWEGFLLGNLVPVTLGNIVGGAVFVGLIYALVYGRKRSDSS